MTVNLLATPLAPTEKMFCQYLDTTPTENMFAHILRRRGTLAIHHFTTLTLYHFNTLTLYQTKGKLTAHRGGVGVFTWCW